MLQKYLFKVWIGLNDFSGFIVSAVTDMVARIQPNYRKALQIRLFKITNKVLVRMTFYERRCFNHLF